MKTKTLKSLLMTSVFTAIGMTTVVAVENEKMAEQNILPPPGPYQSLPEQTNAWKQNGLRMPMSMMERSSINQPPRTFNMPARRGYPQQQANVRPEWRAQPPVPLQRRYMPPPRPEWAQRPPQMRNMNPPAPPGWVQQQRDQYTQQWQNPPAIPEWVQKERAKHAQKMQNMNSPAPPEWVQQQREQHAQQWQNPPAIPEWVQKERAKRAQQMQNMNPPAPPEWVQQQRDQHEQQMKNWKPPVQPQWQAPEQAQPQQGGANQYAAPDARGPVYGPGFAPPAYGYPPVR